MVARIDIVGGKKWQDPYRAVRPNPLRHYTSSTYNISLGFMTPEVFNAFNQGQYQSLEQNIMISSGGISTGKRNKYFDVDFYIEDLDIESVIGLNAVTRAANSTRIQFKIVEPNGFTFFNRIYFLCRDIKIPNYLNIPYFLLIKFLGWDDVQDRHGHKAQSPPFAVPIMITQVKSSVSASGAEYQIEAVPYYDAAIFDNLVSVVSDTTITAATVGDFFKHLSESINKNNQLAHEKLAVVSPGTEKNFYTTVKFDIDPKIAQAKISDDSTVSSAGIFGADIARQITVLSTQISGPNLALQGRRIPNGSNLVDVVDNVLKTSTYITEQQIDAALTSKIKTLTGPALKDEIEKISATIKKPLMWYKVKPKIDIKGYDEVTNQYAKEITYQIKQYKIYNGKDPNFVGWGESVPVKRYQYIFTGKNEDILDFSIKFDNLYHLIVLANANKNQLLDGLASAVATEQSLADGYVSSLPKGHDPNSPSYDSCWPVPTANRTVDARRQAYTSDSSARGQRASLFATNVVTGAEGDMIEITLDIIGDPEYLVGYNEQDFAEANEQVRKSLNLDTATQDDSNTTSRNLENMPSLSSLDQEINCYINFKSPQDYNPDTGVMIQEDNPQYIDSTYDGVYKIITVRSSFNSGVFKQTLTCVRLPNQTADYRFAMELEQMMAKSPDGRVTDGTASSTTADVQDGGAYGP
jgi:hypothetical protein